MDAVGAVMEAPSDLMTEARGRAEALLLANDSELGLLASPRLYRQVWARDSMLSGLGQMLCGDERAHASFRRSLATLGRYQSELGKIPHNVERVAVDPVDTSRGSAQQGEIVLDTAHAGCVDSNLWFVLGLGSQIKPHITKRFSMEWSKPAARMREMVLAMHAIWDSWMNGTKLDFRGDFYTHTLMTPFFNPGPSEYGPPKVFLAGVGELMTEVAGEVCDGFLCHGFTTERYLREVTLPALQRGRAKAGKTMEGFELSGPMFVVTGRDEAEMAAAAKGVRGQIAFYGSTPAYRKVLDLHGWGDLQDELNRMSKEGRWAEMGELIDDDILNEFAVVAPADEVAARLVERWGDALSRLSFYTPYQSDDAQWDQVIADLQAA